MTEDEKVDPLRLAAEVIAEAEASSENLTNAHEVRLFWTKIFCGASEKLTDLAWRAGDGEIKLSKGGDE